MANILTFQTQIASVMEVLANAAVAEICKLVEDSYAELHLEISQTKNENNLLKKKLKTIEIRDSFYRRAHKLMNESTSMTRTSVHEKVSGKDDWNGNHSVTYGDSGDSGFVWKPVSAAFE
jgi:cell division septum initiation protein DivIVA